MYEVTAGATSQLVDIFVQDSSVTTGAGLSGLVYNTASLACYYKRQGSATWTAVTLADMTQGTWASGGFKEGDATHAKGVYEFGIPDAAIASAAGVTWVDISFYGATNMAQVVLRILLKKADFQDGVRLGLTALPNAATDATGGLHSPVVRGGTAQATGNTTSAIKLDSGASSQTDAYKRMVIRITSGTSAGSFGVVNAYNGTSKVATISGTWQFGTPNNTSVFVVLDYGLGAIWDELVTGAVHNVQNSAATFLRNASGGGAISIRSGTAQAGSTATTIKLDSGASATNNVYNNATVVLTGGTGLGQTRTIIAYNGTTKVATVAGSWVTTPDGTTTFAIYAAPTSLVSDQGTAQAGAASTLTLAATASATDNIYNGSFLTLTGGTDAGETHVITAYNGTTKVATVDTSWSVTPDSTTTYAVIPSGAAATDSAPAPPTSADIVSTLMGTAIPATDLSAVTAPTAADAYAAALSQGAGAWEITGTTLTLKNLDGTTFRTFTLGAYVATPATVPTTRT